MLYKFKMFRNNHYTLSILQTIYVKFMFGQAAKLELFRKLIPFLEDGVDLHQVIGLLAKEYKNLSPIDARGMLLAEWDEAMQNAHGFAETTRPWVSDTDAMMLASGEKGGKLINALTNVVDANEDVSRIKSAVKSSLSYPAILFVVLVGIMILSRVQIIPTLTEIMPVDQWPASSQDFYYFTHLFTGNLPLMFGLIIGLSWAIKHSFGVWTNPLRKYFDRLPPWSAFKRISSAMFLISMSALMATGLPAYDSVESLHKYSSAYVKQQLEKTLSLLDNGRDLGQALDTDFMDRETGMDIRIYAKSSDATKTIDRVGRNAIDNTISGIAKIADIVRYVIMGSVAGYMIWMIVTFQAVSQSLKSSMPV